MSATTQHSTIKSTELENIMSYCYGTEHYYKTPQYSFNYTDGVKTFCEKPDIKRLPSIIKRLYEKIKEGKINALLNHIERSRKKELTFFSPSFFIFFCLNRV